MGGACHAAKRPRCRGGRRPEAKWAAKRLTERLAGGPAARSGEDASGASVAGAAAELLAIASTRREPDDASRSGIARSGGRVADDCRSCRLCGVTAGSRLCRVAVTAAQQGVNEQAVRASASRSAGGAVRSWPEATRYAGRSRGAEPGQVGGGLNAAGGWDSGGPLHEGHMGR